MSDLSKLSLKIRNYKCFEGEEQGYDVILPINVIIGRNNSGKSSLLDLIDQATSPKDIDGRGHNGYKPSVIFSDAISEDEVPTRQVNYDQQIMNELKPWIGLKMKWEMSLSSQIIYRHISIDPSTPEVDAQFGSVENINLYKDQVAAKKGNPFNKFRFVRLLADRDISPEVESDSLSLFPNGSGATTTLKNFLIKESLPSALVEESILNDLNLIFGTDGHFTRILVQQRNDNLWEVFVEEEQKGRIPITQTGSGIKTVLLVLCNLHLSPRIDGRSLDQYLFGFEELENNLHPALQRRLLLYLRQFAVEKGSRFFLTTHSNIAIDLFANDDKAQILHVVHNKKSAIVKRVSAYIDNKNILDDLDIRASDLLQANGIVWVEGPSDRLYFNRWVELWSEGNLKEGAHYQCVFYGGRLLSHLSVDDPETANELIKILRVNRNAILLIDSDRRNSKQEINSTKQRILSEIEHIGGFGWLTFGKEVENYIPQQALSSFYKKRTSQPLKQYHNFSDYLNKIQEKEGQRFLNGKVAFAEKICPYMSKENLSITLDLAEKINTACKIIKEWNGLEQ